MWWLLGGLAAVVAGLVAVIARRGGSMTPPQTDGEDPVKANRERFDGAGTGGGSIGGGFGVG
ncbi:MULTISPECIES: hypothetical protein [Janibacter]|uniref:Uncharacterized protein n=1 Tax=Janibacter indicus TaxID=857417 RepID=A0A1W1ZI75_9MICO|nr:MULTISPECIES: hypothetical protein [Janibacter]QNF93597.1 hypothetical protein H7A72_12660 [Janibacter sp. YB324]SMC48199.1 hypothetical protein SAMN06296429_10420 [Janibacter indicus]